MISKRKVEFVINYTKIKPIFGGRDPFLNNNGGSSNDNDESTDGQEPIGNPRELATSLEDSNE
jgi:hypothetical protein